MKKLIKSSALEDAFTVYPWSSDVSYIDGDSGLGLSYVVEAYGDEFMNLDESTLEDSRDILERYFDDDAYVRDWNINYPDENIESIYDVVEPEDLSVGELARYFDYEAYGRDIRLENNMIWDRTRKCWFSGVDTDEYDEDNVVFLSNSRKSIKSGRYVVEDENGEVIASADTYEEAETVGGAKIVDSNNISQSKVGDLRTKFIMGDMTEDELFDALIDEVDNDKAERLVEKWKPNVIKQNISQSVDKAVGEAEDYFGTLANGNTVCCTNIITLADKEEVQKIAEKNDCDVKIGEFSVVFFDKKEAADNYKEMLGQSKKPITSANNYGWEIDSSEAFTALDSFEAAYGNETALNELSQAMGTDSLEENLDYIAQSFDFADEVEGKDVWEKFDIAKEILGDELLENLARAMGADELAECMAFIFRQYDFQDDEITSSRKPIKSSVESIKDIVEDSLIADYISEWSMYGDEDNSITKLARELQNDPDNKELLVKFLKEHAKWADDSDIKDEADNCRKYLDELQQVNSSRKLLKSNIGIDDETVVEILENGHWEMVGLDNTPEGWSTNGKAKIFKNEEVARSSALIKRLANAGYSEKDGNLRFSQYN